MARMETARFVACRRLAAIFGMVLIPGTAAFAQCVKEAKDVSIGGSAARFANYACTAPSGSKVNVQFLRLSEAAAAGVIKGQLWPEVQGYLGGARLVENAVSAETRMLFDKFGKTQDEETAYYVETFAPKVGKGTEKSSAGSGIKQMTYLTFPDTEGLTEQSIALPDEDAEIKSSTSWPADFKFYYLGVRPDEVDTKCSKPEDYACVMLWRAMNAEDVRLFEERFQRQEKLLAAELGQLNDPADENPEIEKIETPGAGILPLISYLTKDGWPQDFIAINGKYSPCGGGYDFGYYPRQLILDVAMIENASAKSVAITEVLGAATLGGLRAANTVPTPERSGQALGTLAPGEKVMVALRINFVVPTGLKETFGTKIERARAFYAIIEKLPAGTIIKEKPFDDQTPPLKKKKESYKPPERPNMSPYVFGPELAMAGLVVDGEEIVLEETSSNFIELTAGEGYGSCPYLYVMNEETGRWVNYGKVIHAADAPSKETTEEVKLHGLAKRFRIAEEELEISHIDRLSLIVELKKGQTVRFEPPVAALKAADKRYVDVAAGKAIEINFDIPDSIKPEDVSEARLAVTGYYRRYSSLQISGEVPFIAAD